MFELNKNYFKNIDTQKWNKFQNSEEFSEKIEITFLIKKYKEFPEK